MASHTFGASAREDFLFAKDYVNLNHGSFGTYPRPVKDELRSFQDAAEARPDVFIRHDYPKLLDKARESVAGLLNVDVGEVVFVSNATTSFNTVMRSLVFSPGDVIIYPATTYGACENTITYITETTPAQAFKIANPYPISDSDLVAKFEEAIQSVRKSGRNPCIAVFDSVVSAPGVRMPFEALTALCKREKVLSCIDAAHGVGMLSPRELDLSVLQPDFLFSNCHKWLFAPRGCAVLYVPVRNQHFIRSTLPTSHGFIPLPAPTDTPTATSETPDIDPAAQTGAPIKPPVNPLQPTNKTAYITNFEFVGTIDNAPYLCVPRAIEYRQQRYGGEDAIVAYVKQLARSAGAIVARALGTEVLENAEGTLQNCAFSNVRLPLDLARLVALVNGAAARGIETAVDGSDSKMVEALAWCVRNWIAQLLIKEYETYVMIMPYAGALWVRLSAQVYLEEKDFERAGEVLKAVCERVYAGEFLVDIQLE